ncbi:hypothetical protein M422DRAFT_253561 [Sphaerobolus stellatus SS14]|uniref:Late embryogenesis abundant protein LEA-2 subgroup domain-containing protein n=1 Tax=Sphaerobolus stellatus (strain SS14) TaxID=990650 RepID=A0A0C9V7R3_SPHS4|nr:hypothetical protein M422DRAFT_253561 [Sphaerobolus stellatus SS14]
MVIGLSTFSTWVVGLKFDVNNPLKVPRSIQHVTANGSVDGTVFINLTHDFDNFTILPGEVVNSGTIQNVLLSQGIIATLNIILLGLLGVESDIVLAVVGKPITVKGLTQYNVSASYTIDLTAL